MTDPKEIEQQDRRWHGHDHRIVPVRWEPYKPDGRRQMKRRGRWQQMVGDGDYHKWENCDRPKRLLGMEEGDKIEGPEAENNRLGGLLWYAWYEINAIRARSGVPLDEHGSPQPIDERYWSNLVDAMSETLGDDATPWPSPQARLLTDELSRGEDG